jgi:hypothetical protein
LISRRGELNEWRLAALRFESFIRHQSRCVADGTGKGIKSSDMQSQALRNQHAEDEIVYGMDDEIHRLLRRTKQAAKRVNTTRM